MGRNTRKDEDAGEAISVCNAPISQGSFFRHDIPHRLHGWGFPLGFIQMKNLWRLLWFEFDCHLFLPEAEKLTMA